MRTFFYVIFLIAGISSSLSAQISGSVFRDFNGNGTKDANEPFVSGVTVNAYKANTAAPCGTATTTGNTAPNYSLTGCSTDDVRLEFVLPSSGTCASSGIDFSSSSAATYGTSVQFVKGNSTNVNFSLQNPSDFNTGTANVNAFVPCYVNGNPLGGGTAGTDDWFVGFPYGSSGSSTPTQKVDGTVLGATWGVAYSKQAGKIFTSAFLKRHIGLGAMGSGGIYMLTPTASSFDVVQFYDLDANGHRTRAAAGAPAFGVGTSFSLNAGNSKATYLGAVDALTGQPAGFGVVGTNVERGLPDDKLLPSYDPASYGQIGKVGLGDLEISDDGKFLFVMNLYQRKIFRLELDNAANPTAVTNVVAIDLVLTGCSSGEMRPFALKYHRGKLYYGAVCSGENGGQSTVGGVSDLSANVFEITTPGGTPAVNGAPILSYPLNYQIGKARSNTADSDKWYPWSDDEAESIKESCCEIRMRPSPMLTDLEFSDRGDLILSFTDRYGHQTGFDNRRFLAADPLLHRGIIAGDIQMAGFNCTTGAFSLENNGSVNSVNGSILTSAPYVNPQVTANQGPGGSEFFKSDYFFNNNEVVHEETSMGAVGVLKGTGEVFSIIMDPVTTIWAGGTRRFSTSDGSLIAGSGYQLYEGLGTAGKANGLGDIELSGIEPPIEIGNRIWKDTDLDGVQDAGEAGINGVEIELYEGTTATGVPVQTVTSATTNGQAGTWFFTNLKSNQAYVIKVKTALGAGALAACTAYSPTGTGTMLTDNNTTTGTITLTTGNAGENNHSFDIGLTSAPLCTAPTPTGVAAERCGTGIVTLTASGCSAAFPAVWYSDAGLATQVGTGNSYTTPSLTTTTDYYVACVETATPTCKSAGILVKATIKPNPTITTTTPVCNEGGTAFEVGYTATALSVITADKGTPDASNNKFTGIPSGETITITATLNGCTANATATASCAIPCPTPNCGSVTVIKN